MVSKPYRIFKAYIRFLCERIFYRDTYVLGQENIPCDGTPVIIASNHQNSFNDALGILMAFRYRKVHFIVRADVFALSPLADRFLRSLGLLPAFRMAYEGEDALKDNEATFRVSGKEIMDGNTVTIFPEAGHAEGHWLNVFRSGFAKLAFGAAEMGDWEQDITIIPTCNHYSSYKGLRTQSLVRFGSPISLKPYYELYRSKPRTAMRAVNKAVRDQIDSMMLDIRDMGHYGEIEFIRNGEYGRKYARSRGLDPDVLPQKLESDKTLVSALYAEMSHEDPYMVDVSSEAGETAAEIAERAKEKRSERMNSAGPLEVPESRPLEEAYAIARELEAKEKDLGIADRQLSDTPKMWGVILRCMCLALLLPLAVFCLWPSAISWLVPQYFARKAEGDMFEGSFLLILNVLFIFPLLGIISLFVVWSRFSLLTAVVYVLMFPAICLFEWFYCKSVRRAIEDVHFLHASREGLTGPLRSMRSRMCTLLDEIL